MKQALMTLAAFASVILLGSSAVVFGPMGKAFAHTFSGNENAAFIAKTEELKGQIDLIQHNLSNPTLVKWHIDKSGEFWTANDTKEVSERNQRVANDVSNGLKTLFSEASKTNPDALLVGQTASTLKDSIGEAVSVRIDPAAQRNATVNALAFRNVIAETLEDYGIAIGSSEEGSSAANATAASTAAPVKITNMAAYQTAQELGTIASNMLQKLKGMSPASDTPTIQQIGKGLTQLQKAIADKEPFGTVTKIIQTSIDPNLQTAYRIQAPKES